MKVRIEPRGAYLFAELRERASGGDMRKFLYAVKDACRQQALPSILICIADSPAVFRAEEYGLDGTARGYIGEIVTPACRIALLGDSSELHHAHEYIEIVARQQGVNMRAFRDQAAAIQWLLSDRDAVSANDNDTRSQSAGRSAKRS